MADKPFSVDLGRLKSREKDRSAAAVERADRAGEELGFVDRDPVKRRGRKPSPRTGQVHAKVLPHVAEEIAADFERYLRRRDPGTDPGGPGDVAGGPNLGGPWER